MDYRLIIEAVIGVLVPLSSITGAYLAARSVMKRVPYQNKMDDSQSQLNQANAMKTMQETIDAQAKAAAKMQDDMDALRKEVENLRKEIDERDILLLSRDHLILDYQDWIARLIHQIRSFGPYQPVPFRSSYPDVDEELAKKLNIDSSE